MQTILKFILSKSYDFEDANGKRITGITCKCFDEDNECIVKVQTDHLVNAKFGDEITVDCVLKGNNVSYVISE